MSIAKIREGILKVDWNLVTEGFNSLTKESLVAPTESNDSKQTVDILSIIEKLVDRIDRMENTQVTTHRSRKRKNAKPKIDTEDEEEDIEIFEVDAGARKDKMATGRSGINTSKTMKVFSDDPNLKIITKKDRKKKLKTCSCGTPIIGDGNMCVACEQNKIPRRKRSE